MFRLVERTSADPFALEAQTLYVQQNDSCKTLPLRSRLPTLNQHLRILRGRLKRVGVQSVS
jgi:hypothetical protein